MTVAVQWLGCVQKLVQLGARTFIEVGPGKVLTGLMRQIDRSQSAMNVEDEASLQKVTNLFAAAAKEQLVEKLELLQHRQREYLDANSYPLSTLKQHQSSQTIQKLSLYKNPPTHLSFQLFGCAN